MEGEGEINKHVYMYEYGAYLLVHIQDGLFLMLSPLYHFKLSQGPSTPLYVRTYTSPNSIELYCVCPSPPVEFVKVAFFFFIINNNILLYMESLLAGNTIIIYYYVMIIISVRQIENK